jgi:hypothetical protein
VGADPWDALTGLSDRIKRLESGSRDESAAALRLCMRALLSNAAQIIAQSDRPDQIAAIGATVAGTLAELFIDEGEDEDDE